MEPRICEGDIVIVRRQNDVNSGEVAIVTVNGNDATIKRLVKYADGIRLVPYNPSYEPIYFTNNEVTEKPVKIIGKVVENRQRY
jgi:repressor LexA